MLRAFNSGEDLILVDVNDVSFLFFKREGLTVDIRFHGAKVNNFQRFTFDNYLDWRGCLDSLCPKEAWRPRDLTKFEERKGVER